MPKTAPSKLANLRELIRLLNLEMQVQAEIADILDDYEQRLYSLDEDRKLLRSTVRDLNNRCSSLETRYSELLYKFSEAVKASQ